MKAKKIKEETTQHKVTDKHNSDKKWPAWHSDLLQYRTPSLLKGTWQLINTLVPYFALWALAILSIKHGYPFILTFALEIIAAAFLVRVFILFHDCVHGSLLPSKSANTVLGHLLGLLTFTPFDDWRFSHLRHHATFADLDARGFGDIWTLTKKEYSESSRFMQLFYRCYRNPIIMVGFGALYTFIFRFRLPTQTAKRKEYMSVLLTNVLIVAGFMVGCKLLGWKTFTLIQLPVVCMAGAAGVWLFFVQHQFVGVYWSRRKDWNPLQAAMEGSSFYKLPPILCWFSGNIGYHHIHHLGARIPNYRLQECYKAIPALNAKTPLTIRQSLSTHNIKLWDEKRKELTGFGSNK